MDRTDCTADTDCTDCMDDIRLDDMDDTGGTQACKADSYQGDKAGNYCHRNTHNLRDDRNYYRILILDSIPMKPYSGWKYQLQKTEQL